MAKVKKIQDFNLAYAILRYYVDITLKLSYRNIRYVGRENIPQDGAVIYAPNHTNALMDALVILAMDRRAKVFVARADIFKNPILAKIFAFLKIMPIMRMRDGLDEVRRNNETIEKAVDVLRDKVPFCIFPEGQHQAKYSSLPLSKGIFRIAFQAQEMMPDVPLYIVPVGIRYGNFFRFRSTVSVHVVEPINVGEFIAAHQEKSPQEQMNIMREDLTERMKSSILYIPNDDDYEAKYEVCATIVKSQAKKIKQSSTEPMKELDAHFQANRLTVKQIDRLMEEQPERAAELLKLGREAAVLRRSRHISLDSVSLKYPVLSRILKLLFFIVALPYCIPVSVLTLPIKLVCMYLCHLMKDKAFHNSARYLVNLVLWPILMIIYAAIAYSFLPWQWVLPVTIVLMPAPIVAHETWRVLRVLISDVKLLLFTELRDKYAKIKNIMYNM
ncbi:MAG: 1-acyl-sn-glycerol-3-phosphate acyltransferase [Alistipes sp.]|nr:1-acyl-sn-glycerol-3-phosphate acyltransferase [Alistipes sp.]MBO5984260.1 1-acyl-sn-glycerol-3-phosphate acyltransferase [Rikenellaceae bacterium]